MAPHSSTLAWKIPWTEESGRLQSMGSLGVGHDWAISLWLFTFMHGGGNGNPLQCSWLENPMDRGAWWAAVYGVAHSRTRLKRLSSSSRDILGCHNWESVLQASKRVEDKDVAEHSTVHRAATFLSPLPSHTSNCLTQMSTVLWLRNPSLRDDPTDHLCLSLF